MYTKGPWTLEIDGSDFYIGLKDNKAYFIRGPNNEYIARLTDETEPREDNGELIALAPEIYKEMKHLAHLVDEVEGEGCMDSFLIKDALTIIATIEGNKDDRQ